MSSPEIDAQRVIGIDGSRAVGRSLTGTETYSRELLTHLSRLAEPGELRVYLNQATVPDSLPSGPDYRAIPMPRFWTHARLAREMVADPPGLLFVPAHVIPPRHPKSVVTIHDVAFRAVPEVFSLRERAELDAATRWNLRSATAVIAVSRSTRDDLIKHYGVDPARIHVVHHGVDTRFRPSTTEETAQVKQHFSLERPYLLAVGTLHSRKNFAAAIKSFEIVIDQGANLDLVIAGGNGPAERDLRKQAAESAHASRIRFSGYVPSNLLPALFGGAELFMLPSWHEGFGMPVLEAMACGTPVLVASTGALPEICGRAAVLVSPDDYGAMAERISAVLENDSYRKSIVDRGLERSSEFTWERTAQMTLRVLRAVRDDQILTEDSLGWLDAALKFRQRGREQHP